MAVKTYKFYLPVIAMCVIAPFAFLVGAASVGAGPGNYMPAVLLFPFSMLLTAAIGFSWIPFMLIAVVQFPLYGLALGYANERGHLFGRAFVLIAIHALAAFLVVAFSSSPVL
jgi:hypothetical protein